MCAERSRLLADYLEMSDAYLRSVQSIGSVGTIAGAQRACDEAQQACAEARSKLELHVAAHGCVEIDAQ
jgi:hypothetical protein